MKTIILILSFYSIVISGCKNKRAVLNDPGSTEEIITINIDIPEKKQSHEIESIAKQYDFLKLKNNDSCFIGRINKAVVYGNKVFILHNKGVHIFQNNGTFIKEIIFGRGPGEIQYPIDILVSDRGNLEILDNIRRSILIYDNDDAAFLNEIKLPFRYIQFQKVDSENYILYASNFLSNERYYYHIYNVKKQRIIQSYLSKFPSLAKRRKFLTTQNINKINDRVYINTPFSDTVYAIDNSLKIFPVFYFDYGKDKLPPDYYRTLGPNDATNKDKYNNSAKGITSLLMVGNIMYFGFSFRRSMVQGMYNRKSGNLYLSDSGQHLLTGNYIRFYPAWPIGKWEEGLIYAIDSYGFIEEINNLHKNSDDAGWKEFRRKNKRIIALYEETTENDNPILVFARY